MSIPKNQEYANPYAGDWCYERTTSERFTFGIMMADWRPLAQSRRYHHDGKAPSASGSYRDRSLYSSILIKLVLFYAGNCACLGF